MIYIYSQGGSEHRGIGRYMKSLLSVIPGSRLETDLSKLSSEDTLIIPSWNYLTVPIITKKYCQNQILCILDLIPLAFPDNFPIGIRGKFQLWKNKKYLKFFDKIVTISHHSKSEIIRLLGVEEGIIEVIYPTLEPIFWENKVDSNQANNFPQNYFLYVGDVNWNKNLVNLAKAIKHANVKCIFVGKIFERVKNIKSQIELDAYLWELRHIEQNSLKEFAKISWGDKRFNFAGYISDSELVSLYDNAVANILVSQDEGFGYSFFEAGARGCPSLVSNIDIFHETAGQGGAFFVDSHDFLDIANQIKHITENTQAREAVSKAAKSRTISMLDLKVVMEKWMRIVR